MSRQPILTGLPGFDAFWAAYPNHVAKGAALKAWRALSPSPVLLATILDALAWQRRQSKWVKDGGEYVPHAATYLRGERWTDEPLVASGNGQIHATAFEREQVRSLIRAGMSPEVASLLVLKS